MTSDSYFLFVYVLLYGNRIKIYVYLVTFHSEVKLTNYFWGNFIDFLKKFPTKPIILLTR